MHSALKHTPKIRRTTPHTISKEKEALVFRNLEKELIELGHMPFAREAEMLCLVARFLHAKGYRAEAKAFSQKAKDKAFFAKVCQQA